MAKAVYIHIPFCQTICSYCDFCKVYYQKKWVKPYIEALKEEITRTYQGEKITSLYIGGGTPSCLSSSELNDFFSLLSLFHFSSNYEFTMEATIETLTEEKIKLMREYGVNRVSIGLETSHHQLLSLMGRVLDIRQVKEVFHLLKKYQLTNINLDLMYALPTENIEMVKEDLAFLLSLNPTHISTYSLILEEHTKLALSKPTLIEEEQDLKMYQLICETLEKQGYNHYEVSNFAKEGYVAKHNLVYWNNEEYYGFGVGAGSYLSKVRRTNTRSITQYLENHYKGEEEILTVAEIIDYEIILGLRKIKGLEKEVFKKKYKESLETVFQYHSLVEKGLLIEEKGCVRVAPNYIYVLNEVILAFLKTKTKSYLQTIV